MIVSYDEEAAYVAARLAAMAPVGINIRSVAVSADFAAYAAGEIDCPRCVLCGRIPCQCPPFGSPEYFALCNRLHKRG